MFACKYHKLLCTEYPSWLDDYIALPCLQRLGGVGLLCGTDWTSLYNNRFFYSRLDHSIGTALITWNFTHDKKQTLASLFHDVATCAFSHVNDFRKGDAIKQEVTEDKTSEILTFDSELAGLLARDGINVCEIRDYHIYPVCDNEIPALSADRLEYMFPSNMSLAPLIKGKVWTFDEVEKMYGAIQVLSDSRGISELGFNNLEMAELYVDGFIDCGLLLQTHENKLPLNMLGKIVNMALEQNVLSEADCMNLSEKNIIKILDDYALANLDKNLLASYIKTWRNMTEVLHLQNDPGEGYYAVNLKVKKRYIDPLVKMPDGSVNRTSCLSHKAEEKIKEFLSFEDTPFGAVALL